MYVVNYVFRSAALLNPQRNSVGQLLQNEKEGEKSFI